MDEAIFALRTTNEEERHQSHMRSRQTKQIGQKLLANDTTCSDSGDIRDSKGRKHEKQRSNKANS